MPVATDAPEHNDWVLKTRMRKKLPRPDAVIIKPTEKLSIDEDVQLVRRTQNGEILLEFRRSAEVSTKMHRSKLRNLLVEEVKVGTVTEETSFKLRYLDEVTREEEIGEIQSSALRKVRNVPKGTRVL